MTVIVKHIALLVCDVDFHDRVSDFEAYKNKLFGFVKQKEESKEVEFRTVSGRYSFRENLKEIPVDDKNKTSFIKSIGDYLSKIDEVIIISNYRHESFLEPLKNQLGEEGVPTTLFSYETKTNGQGKA